MADVHSPKIRSYNMSKIKGKNTKPELLVRRYLHSKGLRFRLHDTGLPGKPDIVLPKYKVVIQVQGCFWHRHDGCKYFVVPKTRTEWWLNKINKTVSRDKENMKKLKYLGWKILIIWECEIKGEEKEKTLNSLYENIICQN
ncbi:DNA mismatch endonuclease Vsr [Flavobacteriaceae bacterium R38]|nr:DNA mismatch endonuclease Vsr [Flavobacteriaceae bacterium R38]